MDLFHHELLLGEVKSQYELLKLYPFKFNLLNHFKGDHHIWNGKKKTVWDPMNTVYFILEGDGFIICKGKKIDLLPNHVYMIPTNCTRQYGCKNFIEKYWCFFQMRNSLGVDFFDGRTDVVEFGPILNQISVKNLFQKISLRSLFEIQNLICGLIESKGMFKEVEHFKYHKLESYLKVFEYIENNLSAKIMTPELGKILDMTPQGFSRAFHRDFGMTVKQFLNQKMNQKACDLILLTELKIKDVAYSLGYADEYYFTRFFTKMNNVSPSHYRLRVKSAEA